MNGRGVVGGGGGYRGIKERGVCVCGGGGYDGKGSGRRG